MDEEKNDKRIRTWNNKNCIFEVPDELIKDILEDECTHTYSINKEKESFTIQKVPNHGAGRDCYIFYGSGKIKFIPSDKFKHKNEFKR